MFERLASNPNTSVEALERLMALWERGEAKKAELAFNAAMSTAQKQMRPVAVDATNPQTRSKYASYEALDRALRPIYTEHGFGLSFDTADSPLAEHVRVVCHVTHEGGHSSLRHLDMPADGKGAKGGDVMTKTHAVGSALSYGMRYLLKMIFNVAVGEHDDDGNAAGKTVVEKKPAGYDNWLDDMTAAADNGFQAFDSAWKASKQEFRVWMTQNDREHGKTLKAKAKAVRS